MSILLERLNREFDNGYHESSFHTIKNLFYFLKAKGTSIQVTYAGLVYLGRVTENTDEFIRLTVPEFKEAPERKAFLHFEALNRYYMCQVFLLRTNQHGVFVGIPTELRYLARRLYQRLHFENLSMRFIILYSPILGSKLEEKNLESRYPHFMQEILLDQPSLPIIYKMLVEEIQHISREFSVTMLYDKPEEELSMLERTVMAEKKSVFIEDVARLETYISP